MTMRALARPGWACLGLWLSVVSPAQAHDGHQRPLVFPDTAEGLKVLSVDLYTHGVFSDGSVWPTIRVEEARRDGIAPTTSSL